MRPAVQEGAETEESDDLIKRDHGLVGSLQPIPQIPPNRKVREQPRVLKYITDTPALHGHGLSRARVGQNNIIEPDVSLIGLEQAGDDIDQGSLPASRAPEQGRNARSGHGKLRLQRKPVTFL